MHITSVLPVFEPLTGVTRTLMLPLAARAQGGKLGHTLFGTMDPMLDVQDPYAQHILRTIGARAHPTFSDGPLMVNVLWRTGVIKQLGHAFFERHPQSLGVNLGAGLSHYFQWLDNGQNEWLDVDLLPVIKLRQSLGPPAPATHNHLAMDIGQPGWWQGLGLHERDHRQPMLLICEGLLMYLHPAQVRDIMREIAENAPEGSEVLLDFVSPLTLGPSPVLPHPEIPDAPFTWGAHNGQDIANGHPRLELQSQRSVSEAYGWGALWADMSWRLVTGGPLYGLAHLRVSEP